MSKKITEISTAISKLIDEKVKKTNAENSKLENRIKHYLKKAKETVEGHKEEYKSIKKTEIYSIEIILAEGFVAGLEYAYNEAKNELN